jgi:hypothetical protein
MQPHKRQGHKSTDLYRPIEQSMLDHRVLVYKCFDASMDQWPDKTDEESSL